MAERFKQLSKEEMLKVPIPKKSICRQWKEDFRRRRGRSRKEWVLMADFQQHSRNLIAESIKNIVSERQKIDQESVKRDVSKYLREQEVGAVDSTIAREWSKLDDLYTKRLWHQLTIALMDFVKSAELAKGTKLIELYENLIQDIEMRINPLTFMEMVALIIKQYTSFEEALAFLDKTEPKIKASKEAVALCKISKGQIKLHELKDISGAKALLEEADEVLRSIDGISSVNGRFYLLQSQLNKTTGDTAEFYRSTLKFLGCTDLNTLSLDTQRDHAKNLSIAALVAPDIYNFGELLAHPVLKSLIGTPYDWLVQLLTAFNVGRMEDFERIRVKWQQEPTLNKHEKSLTDKIRLLCLMEMTFKRPATERTLTFQEIASETKLKEDQVEIYVMKAIANGLLKGHIDKISKKVQMTWVQPRVLDRVQIGLLTAFNVGRMEDFERIRVKWQQEPTLNKHEKSLTVNGKNKIPPAIPTNEKRKIPSSSVREKEVISKTTEDCEQRRTDKIEDKLIRYDTTPTLKSRIPIFVTPKTTEKDNENMNVTETSKQRSTLNNLLEVAVKGSKQMLLENPNSSFSLIACHSTTHRSNSTTKLATKQNNNSIKSPSLPGILKSGKEKAKSEKALKVGVRFRNRTKVNAAGSSSTASEAITYNKIRKARRKLKSKEAKYNILGTLPHTSPQSSVKKWIENSSSVTSIPFNEETTPRKDNEI